MSESQHFSLKIIGDCLMVKFQTFFILVFLPKRDPLGTIAQGSFDMLVSKRFLDED